MTDPITRFTAAIESATIPAADVFAADVVLDATVPNWRFSVRGAPSVEQTLDGWVRGPRPFRVADGERIVRGTVYCGGRWNSALMAEMAEAQVDALDA